MASLFKYNQAPLCPSNLCTKLLQTAIFALTESSNMVYTFSPLKKKHRHQLIRSVSHKNTTLRFRTVNLISKQMNPQIISSISGNNDRLRMHTPIVMASAIENDGFFVFYLQAFSFSILTFCLSFVSFFFSSNETYI